MNVPQWSFFTSLVCFFFFPPLCVTAQCYLHQEYRYCISFNVIPDTWENLCRMTSCKGKGIYFISLRRALKVPSCNILCIYVNILFRFKYQGCYYSTQICNDNFIIYIHCMLKKMARKIIEGDGLSLNSWFGLEAFCATSAH